MKREASFRRLGVAVVILSLAVFCGSALAAEFTADTKEAVVLMGDNAREGKIQVKGSKYRMDIVEGDEKVVVIVDPAAGKTVVINAAIKEYKELAIDDMASVMSDPFQAYNYVLSMGEERSDGVDTVLGYECDKTVISMQDTDVMSRWQAKSLDFPIKIVAHGPPDKVLVLTNIVEGPVDDARFAIPVGYTKWIDPETLPVEPPAWAEGISGAPVMAPPFEHDMSAGDIVRIKVEPGKSLAIKGVSKTETEGTARAIPFKDGRPLKEDTWYNNFAQNGVICSRLHETSGEVDEFVVYVYEGNLATTAKWQEMLEKTVAEGEELRLPLQGWDNPTARLVNLGDAESVATMTYFLNGTELSEDEQGPVKWRTITLKEPGEFDSGARSHKGDEIVFSVQKGKMLIKIGQFDSFEF